MYYEVKILFAWIPIQLIGYNLCSFYCVKDIDPAVKTKNLDYFGGIYLKAIILAIT